MLIDVAIPSDYNITQKESEKHLKYRDLQIEVHGLWNVKTKVLPVVIGVAGLISSKTDEIMKQIPGKNKILCMQKTVVLSTAHILSKVLQS